MAGPCFSHSFNSLLLLSSNWNVLFLFMSSQQIGTFSTVKVQEGFFQNKFSQTFQYKPKVLTTDKNAWITNRKLCHEFFFSDSIMMPGVDVRSLFLHSVPGKFLYHAGCVSSEACEPETKESVIALWLSTYVQSIYKYKTVPCTISYSDKINTNI